MVNLRRIVIDTNILIAAAYAPGSSSRRVVELCLDGECVAIVSSALRREYQWILPRAIRLPQYELQLAGLIEGAQLVQPPATPRVVPEDAADDQLFAAAVAGGAGAIVTNDRPVLALDPYGEIRVVCPADWLDLVVPGDLPAG